ncbi:hypothetical protein PBY51_018764 [Eleginops maclovinus]|uniref:Uncharacterized protein n=1 Tax=Eleginops maclovinus TaxID=56733 RepID=A0AAN7YEW5_ELEMC|nr:hypothetical protein PBY51_018764 [Eleginops maclovinus]
MFCPATSSSSWTGCLPQMGSTGRETCLKKDCRSSCPPSRYPSVTALVWVRVSDEETRSLGNRCQRWSGASSHRGRWGVRKA